jgi:hypothetical protein
MKKDSQQLKYPDARKIVYVSKHEAENQQQRKNNTPSTKLGVSFKKLSSFPQGYPRENVQTNGCNEKSM